MSPQTETGPSDYEIVDTMIEMGGSFVQALGKAFRVADTENQRRLKITFPEYWATYTRAAIARKRVHDA